MNPDAGEIVPPPSKVVDSHADSQQRRTYASGPGPNSTMGKRGLNERSLGVDGARSGWGNDEGTNWRARQLQAPEQSTGKYEESSGFCNQSSGGFGNQMSRGGYSGGSSTGYRGGQNRTRGGGPSNFYGRSDGGHDSYGGGFSSHPGGGMGFSNRAMGNTSNNSMGRRDWGGDEKFNKVREDGTWTSRDGLRPVLERVSIPLIGFLFYDLLSFSGTGNFQVY